jgi:hypothetical protein
VKMLRSICANCERDELKKYHYAILVNCSYIHPTGMCFFQRAPQEHFPLNKYNVHVSFSPTENLYAQQFPRLSFFQRKHFC